MKRSKWEAWRPSIVGMVARLRKDGIDVDRIPYTQRFDDLYDEFVNRCNNEISRSEFFWELVVIRKNFDRFVERYGAA